MYNGELGYPFGFAEFAISTAGAIAGLSVNAKKQCNKWRL